MVSSSGMSVPLKTDLRFPITGQQGHGSRNIQLKVVAENARALSMYEKAGFVEYGRNPKGFNSRMTGFQEVVYMRLEL